MKIWRRHRGPVTANHIGFWIYDETRTVPDTTEEDLRKKFNPILNIEPDVFYRDLTKNVRELDAIVWGPTQHHPKFAYVQVNRDGTMHFEFDNEHPYTPDELRAIMRKANAAKKRITWGEPKS